MNNVKKEAIEKAKQETKPKRKVLFNTAKAFFVGGMICLLAQIIIDILKKQFELDNELANSVGVAIMVFLGSLLTGLGIYDKIGQFAGGGDDYPDNRFRKLNDERRAGIKKRRHYSRRLYEYV